MTDFRAGSAGFLGLFAQGNDALSRSPAGSEPVPPNSSEKAAPARKPRSNTRLTVIAAIIIVVGLVIAAYALTVVFHKSGNTSPQSAVLAAEGTYYSIPIFQFNGVAFSNSGTAEINGTFTNTYGLILYTMTPTQFENLSKKGVVPGYEWTSGTIGHNTIYSLNLEVQPGAWVLVFANPNTNETTLITTLVGFYSNLTLTPT